MDYNKLSVKKHLETKGKLEIKTKMPIENQKDLSIAYTPGVAQPCLEIASDEKKSYDMTSSKNTVAVISDGTAVLGLGDIGPVASLPVMEGKCALFKKFAGVDAFPIVLNTKDTEEIISTIKNIAITFGGINLEDISAPRCFEIEKRLSEELKIPVFHDDQHGTAIVVLAGLINALKLTNKKKEDVKVVVNGVGAAGIAIINLMRNYGIKNISAIDSKGGVCKLRDDLNSSKKNLLDDFTQCGTLEELIVGADVFIGVSKGNVLTKSMVESMNDDSIIFAMANPTPEIEPKLAYEAGAKIVATGRSDHPNQLNNVLVFPGIFKGAFEVRANKITDDMKISAAIGLAKAVDNLTVDKIIPNPFDNGVSEIVAKSVIDNYKK